MDVVELIQACAKIPSFSTFEERLHSFIYDYLTQFKNANITQVKDNNLAIFVEGKKNKKPVVVASHLDKINHYGSLHPEILEVELKAGKIFGQMDDAAGIGICLNLIREAQHRSYPPLLVLFSEMEESTGLKHHPHLLKNNGRDVGPQIGARRLCSYVEGQKLNPAVFITIDTSPVFKGDPGVALYTEFWEKMEIEPDSGLLDKIEKIRKCVLSMDPDVRLANGTNDYLVYGAHFGKPEKGNVPSIAIEPAIFPYHQIGEGVYVKDIYRIISLLDAMLTDFDFDAL